MANLFFIGDTHFGHANIITFKNKEGVFDRPFASIEEHDQNIIDCWNKVVRPQDTVYHCGDVAIPRKGLEKVALLNGRKILLRGNHDIFKLEDYTKVFDDVRAYKVFTEDRFIACHIPIHPDSVARWNLNIHGHLHSNLIDDNRYFNVSCERVNFTPISFEDIKARKKIRDMA